MFRALRKLIPWVLLIGWSALLYFVLLPLANAGIAGKQGHGVGVGVRRVKPGPRLWAPLTESTADQRGATATFSNVGPLCQWVDGLIDCEADDVPRFAGEIPPSLTGAGEPDSGMQFMPSYTNSAVYSEDLSSWGVSGTPVVTCGLDGSDLFADGRTVCTAEDNDAAGYETIQTSTIDISALNAGDKVTLCVYAKADSVGAKAQAYVQEIDGAGCSSSNHFYAKHDYTTDWRTYKVTHTIQDGDCTGLIPKINPAATTGATSDVASGYFVVQAFLGIDYCPPIYIKTQAAAVTAGADTLTYTTTALPYPNGKVSFRYTPGTTSTASRQFIHSLSGPKGLNVYIHPDDFLYLRTGDGTTLSITTSSSALTWTPGTTYLIEAEWRDGTHILRRDGVVVGSGTGKAMINSGYPASMGVGVSNGGLQPAIGWLSDVRFYR